MNVRYYEVQRVRSGSSDGSGGILMAVWQCLMVAWFGRAVYVGYSDLLFAEDIGMVGDIGGRARIRAERAYSGSPERCLLGLFVALNTPDEGAGAFRRVGVYGGGVSGGG